MSLRVSSLDYARRVPSALPIKPAAAGVAFAPLATGNSPAIGECVATCGHFCVRPHVVRGRTSRAEQQAKTVRIRELVLDFKHLSAGNMAAGIGAPSRLRIPARPYCKGRVVAAKTPDPLAERRRTTGSDDPVAILLRCQHCDRERSHQPLGAIRFPGSFEPRSVGGCPIEKRRFC